MPSTDDILIVDDSHESLLLLANILKQAGYNVRPADSGELALASVKAKAPALILLDVLMPYPDGFEVCRQLKARPSSCSIPVIFITSLNDVAERVQGLNIGGVDFISKPFQREELLSRVHTHLLLSKLQAGLEQQVAERTEQLQQANQQLQNELNERLLAEAALRESESRFFSAFMYAPVGKALVSSEGAFLKVNPALCQLLGYTEEELLSRTFQEITHPDDLETDLAYVHQMLAGEITTYQMQKRYFRKDGNIVWALLSVSLSHDRNGSPQYFISQIVDITERKQAEDQIKQALAEKETLLRELYHRTKNNMQVISSLISLQEDELDDPRMIAVLRELHDRIMAMSMVHQKLYQSRSLSTIDLGEYVRDLTELLVTTYRVSESPVRLDIQVESIPVPINIAIPCGLILNELVSNALKYAFLEWNSPPNPPAQIKINLTREENAATLIIADNGRGVPDDFDPAKTGRLGLQLVLMMGKSQLHGKVLFHPNPGFTCEVRFPITE